MTSLRARCLDSNPSLLLLFDDSGFPIDFPFLPQFYHQSNLKFLTTYSTYLLLNPSKDTCHINQSNAGAATVCPVKHMIWSPQELISASGHQVQDRWHSREELQGSYEV